MALLLVPSIHFCESMDSHIRVLALSCLGEAGKVGCVFLTTALTGRRPSSCSTSRAKDSCEAVSFHSRGVCVCVEGLGAGVCRSQKARTGKLAFLAWFNHPSATSIRENVFYRMSRP